MDAITPWEDDADPGAAPPARKDEPHLGPMVPATSNLFHYHDDGVHQNAEDERSAAEERAYARGHDIVAGYRGRAEIASIDCYVLHLTRLRGCSDVVWPERR